MKTRRSTATLTLVLIGASALHGCGGGDDETATRDVYRTQADCQRDWGDDPKKCEQQRSGSHSGMFYGPLMYGMGRMGSGASQSTMAPRKGSSAIGSTAVSSGGSSTSRGGFGSSASAHSSGG